MTTMHDALAELGWSDDLIEAFTASPHYSLSTPKINVSLNSCTYDQTTLVVDQTTSLLSSGTTLELRS